MNNYIIQLEPNPISTDELMAISDIPEWFIHSVADYVIDVDYLDEALANILEGWNTQYELFHNAEIPFIPVCITFGVGFKREHFKVRHQRLLNLISDMDDAPITLGDFCSYSTTWYIKDEFDEIITDEGGVWVFSYGDLMPFDTFVRTMQSGQPYYIGNILDYHM